MKIITEQYFKDLLENEETLESYLAEFPESLVQADSGAQVMLIRHDRYSEMVALSTSASDSTDEV